MKRSIPMLAAACLIAGCGRSDDGRLARDETWVRVGASATVETKPDEARFSVGVSSIAPSAEAATAANTAKMSAVVAKLRALGIAERDLQTRQLTVNRIGYGPNRNRFEVNNIVSARVRDIAKAGPAIAAATGVGANVLSGPDFRVSDPEAASRDAYARAYRSARARADAYAAAAGLKVARVLTIADGPGSGEPPPMDAVYEQAAAPRPVSAPPPVMPGMTSGTVSVTVDYALSRGK